MSAPLSTQEAAQLARFSPPMPVFADITAAIPCRGREASLITCLRNVSRCNPLPCEVLIHADGDWQPQALLAEDWPFPVRLLSSPQLIGPGGGRDRMIRESCTEIVASFDDDSWPLDVDYFAKALAVAEAFPQAVVIGAEVFLTEKPLKSPQAIVQEATDFDGSGSIHRRSLYLKLPGYVPLAEAYAMEEVDVSLQAHAEGLQILNCPWLRAWHDRPMGDFRHSTLPWIRNEALFVHLRYPWFLWPLGWVRVVRRAWHHWGYEHLRNLLHAALSSFELARKLASHRRRYSVKEVYRHHRGPRRRWAIEIQESSPSMAITAHELRPSPKILYLQYTNPASYPPLEHSSSLLASRGWAIKFLGVTHRQGTTLKLPGHSRIWVRTWRSSSPGFQQKLHYAMFTFWCLWRALRFRPDWIYCSDSLAAPAALIIAQVARQIVYHEHDSPSGPTSSLSWIQRVQRWSRRRLAAKARVVVLPNQERLNALIGECHPSGRTFCVWNCPSRDEVQAPRPPLAPSGTIRLLYHGSINPDRFPLRFLDALAMSDARLAIRLVGYETEGSRGYTSELVAAAEKLRLGDRFEFLGSLPNRSDLMARCAECDVGLSLLHINDRDINMQHMAGASNKPFDYLSQGLALVVPDDPAWRALYVENGCAIACAQDNIESLIETFNWLAAHPVEIRAMGRRGQKLINTLWNYETQFKPVLDLIEAK